MVEFGLPIIPPTVPEREGYDFSWGYIPNAMPANEISIYGYYTIKTGIYQTVIDKNGDTTLFALDGRRVYSTKKGLIIVRTNNRETKKIIVK